MTIRISALALLIITALGSGCTSSRTLTVYCHEGALVRTDLGTPGPSQADLTTWWADVHETLPESLDPADSPVVGIASGFNVVTVSEGEVTERPSREYRVSNFHLVWFDSNDELVWTGLHDYGHDDGRLINVADRPISGGTGRFLGSHGRSVVTPLGDKWFQVDLYIEN